MEGVCWFFAIVITLLLILIAVFEILIWTKCCTVVPTSGFENPITAYFKSSYVSTEKEIRDLYRRTNCTKGMTYKELDNARRIPKELLPQFFKELLTKNKCVDYTNVITNIPDDKLNELKRIWQATNCPADFPIDYLKNALKRNPKVNLQNVLKSYIEPIAPNLENNSYDSEDLAVTFKKCYGPEWKNNKSLKDKYNDFMGIIE
jgi:hypothetical protein